MESLSQCDTCETTSEAGKFVRQHSAFRKKGGTGRRWNIHGFFSFKNVRGNTVGEGHKCQTCEKEVGHCKKITVKKMIY